MNPYSVDLRERIIANVREGKRAQAAIAATFEVSDATVENWWRQWRETGSVEPKPFAAGAPRTLKTCAAAIRAAVQQQPDATLQELCDAVAAQTGVPSSPSMMCRELQILKLPRKKIAARQSTRYAARHARRQEFQECVVEPLRELTGHLKFIDESGAHLGLTRLYGRAAPGERVREGTPGYSGKHYTVVAALGRAEIGATTLLEGGMTGDAFDAYVEHVLTPTLQSGDIVLIDNLNVHKSEVAQRLIAARGARLEFLPPYSPDLNPIELCWAKVKTVLRKLKARTFDELVAALSVAFASITPQDCQAWFVHCGYRMP